MMSQRILNMFGCCGEKSPKRDRNSTKGILLGPTTNMNLQKPPNHAFNILYQGSHHKARSGPEFKEDLENTLTNRSILQAYPFNEVFILGNKYKIVAIITRKKIDKDNSVQVSLRDSLSSLTKENVRDNSNSTTSSKAKWSNLVKNCASIENKKEVQAGKEDKLTSSNASYNANPESLGAYLASRLRCEIMVDAICGCGETTKYFGSSCNFVVAFEKDAEKLLSGVKNQEIDSNIDFINADFNDVSGFQADIVFIDLADGKNSDGDGQILDNRDLSQKLEDALSKALKMTKGSVVVKLPGDTSLDELPKIFQNALEGDESLDMRRCCIEIEEIVNANHEVENIVVYFGHCSIITLMEEYTALYDYLSSTQQPKWRLKFQMQVVMFILEKVGTRRSLRYISEIEDFVASNPGASMPLSFFDIFLEKVIGDNILSKPEITKLIKEESKRPSSFIFSIANSYTSKFTLLDHSNSAVSSQYNLTETVEETKNKKEAKKQNNNKEGFRNSYSEIPFGHSQDNTTQTSHKETQNKSANFYSEFTNKKPFSFKDLGYNGGSLTSQDLKHSCEVSNLENYLSSDEGECGGKEAARENGGVPSFRTIDNKSREAIYVGTLTPEDVNSPGLVPVNYSKRVGKQKKSSKWKEFSSENLNLNTESQFVLVEEKMHQDELKTNENKSKEQNFFVRRKNVFLENEIKQGE